MRLEQFDSEKLSKATLNFSTSMAASNNRSELGQLSTSLALIAAKFNRYVELKKDKANDKEISSSLEMLDAQCAKFSGTLNSPRLSSLLNDSIYKDLKANLDVIRELISELQAGAKAELKTLKPT